MAFHCIRYFFLVYVLLVSYIGKVCCFIGFCRGIACLIFAVLNNQKILIMDVNVIIRTDLNALINQATAAKFNEYSDCGVYGLYRCLTLTCLEGKYNGEVIEISYTDNGVCAIDIYSQFKGQTTGFKFN